MRKSALGQVSLSLQTHTELFRQENPMLRIALISMALIVGVSAASARTATLSKNVFACTQWAGWHDYTLASLTPQGARAGKYCPIRINAGVKVEVTDESDPAGSATVQYKGKSWVIDGDAVP
jgi:hypothetical protein